MCVVCSIADGSAVLQTVHVCPSGHVLAVALTGGHLRTGVFSFCQGLTGLDPLLSCKQAEVPIVTNLLTFFLEEYKLLQLLSILISQQV